MPPDNQRWFNSPAHADTLLRILLQPSDPGEPAADCPTPADVGAIQPDAQLLGTSKQTPNETIHPEQASSNDNRKTERDTPCGIDKSSSDPGSKWGGETSQPVRAYHAHALVLRGQSAYFNASLGEVWQQQQQQQQEHEVAPSFVPSAPGTILDLHLDPGQEDAMDLLLRFMYDHPLPAVTPDNTPLLFQCLRLADRFDVPQFVSAIISALKGAVSSVVLHHVSLIPPGITDRPEFEALLLSAKRYMEDTYGDVPAVTRCEQLRREFCSLPFAAVLAWAESDELRVQSENCVVYLLSAWVKAARHTRGQGVSADQLEQLAQQVRVLHLGPAYQHHILPRLRWFKGCKSMAHLPTLLACKGKDAAGSVVFPAEEEFPDDFREFPAQWVAKARQQSRVTDADRVLRWEVGEEQLQQLYKGGEQLEQLITTEKVFSLPLYLNGFMLGMFAESGAAADGAKTLGLYVGVDPEQAKGGIPWPSTAAVKFGPVDLKVLHGPEGGVSHKMLRVVQVGMWGWGDPDMLSEPVPSVSELLAPYLRDGKLHVEAKFTTVDQP